MRQTYHYYPFHQRQNNIFLSSNETSFLASLSLPSAYLRQGGEGAMWSGTAGEDPPPFSSRVYPRQVNG